MMAVAAAAVISLVKKANDVTAAIMAVVDPGRFVLLAMELARVLKVVVLKVDTVALKIVIVAATSVCQTSNVANI